jgi:cold shock CspA family protein
MTKVNDPVTLVVEVQEPQRLVEPWETGIIKFFDQVRRWGFIIPDEPDELGQDVFFPWTVLKSCGIPEREARDGIRVRFKRQRTTIPGRRPAAIKIVVIRTTPR